MTGLRAPVLRANTGPRCATVLVQGRPEAIRGEYRRITAVIGWDDTTAVLDNAIILCRLRGAHLRVLHMRRCS